MVALIHSQMDKASESARWAIREDYRLGSKVRGTSVSVVVPKPRK